MIKKDDLYMIMMLFVCQSLGLHMSKWILYILFHTSFLKSFLQKNPNVFVTSHSSATFLQKCSISALIFSETYVICVQPTSTFWQSSSIHPQVYRSSGGCLFTTWWICQLCVRNFTLFTSHEVTKKSRSYVLIFACLSVIASVDWGERWHGPSYCFEAWFSIFLVLIFCQK